MKKLMIAAVAAMVGMVAGAATTNWNSMMAMSDGTVETWFSTGEVSYAPSGWKVLIFDSNFTQGTKGQEGYVETSFTTLQTALAAGDKTTLATLFNYRVGDGTTGDFGAFAIDNATMSERAADAGKKYVDGYAIILDADDLDNANYAFLLQEQTKEVGAAGTIITINNIDPLVADYNGYLDMTTYKNGTGSGANWYSVGSAVPEPTSGLLLLLGVAGLALRRRRA